MEIQAVIEALRRVKTSHLPIEVYSDSAYVVNCMRDRWYIRWRKNGWRNAKKKPVENKSLWIELLGLVEKQSDIKFVHIKGHSGIELNEVADQLATKGADEVRKTKERVDA